MAYHNSRSIELFGIPPEELRSLNEAVKARTHPDDLWKIEKAIVEMSAQRDFESNEVEIRLLNQIGSVDMGAPIPRSLYQGRGWSVGTGIARHAGSDGTHHGGKGDGPAAR